MFCFVCFLCQEIHFLLTLPKLQLVHLHLEDPLSFEFWFVLSFSVNQYLLTLLSHRPIQEQDWFTVVALLSVTPRTGLLKSVKGRTVCLIYQNQNGGKVLKTELWEVPTNNEVKGYQLQSRKTVGVYKLSSHETTFCYQELRNVT